MDLEEICYFMLWKYSKKSIVERIRELKDKVNDFVDRIFWLNVYYINSKFWWDLMFRKGYLIDFVISDFN